jgi:ABC-type transport system involved in cytochrome c biogenesis permease subunit
MSGLTNYVGLLAGLALACYAGSAFLYGLHLVHPTRARGIGATTLGAFGAVLNLLALWARAKALHSVPYKDLLGSMALFGFFLAVLNLVLEARHADRSLGPFLVPAALVFMLASFLLPHEVRPTGPELRGSVFALHVTLNMLAYAAFAVACALSVLYLFVGRSLKSRSIKALEGTVSRLPTLSYLERANRTSLGVGVLALACGLGLGLFWGARVWGTEHPHWILDPKIVMAFLTLAFYLIVLLRAHRGASPRITARLSVAGFAIVLFSYTAVNLLASRLHVFT